MTNRQVAKLAHCIGIDLAAVLVNAPEQAFFGSAERTIYPARVLAPGIPLLHLQDPLMRFIDDSPMVIDPGHRPNGRVRWQRRGCCGSTDAFQHIAFTAHHWLSLFQTRHGTIH